MQRILVKDFYAFWLKVQHIKNINAGRKGKLIRQGEKHG
jgi:hypothetical protein